MNATEKKRIQVQLDKDISDNAEAIFSELGMTTTAAINLFYKRVIATKGIPFDVTLSPTETAFKHIQAYSNFFPKTVIDTKEEFIEWLNDDDNW